MQCKIRCSKYGDLCCLLGSLETKEQSVFSIFGLKRSETGVAYGGIDAEMLECVGDVETDGEIRRCDGEARTCGNVAREYSGWTDSYCTRC
jgi:hypothetical protein